LIFEKIENVSKLIFHISSTQVFITSHTEFFVMDGYRFVEKLGSGAYGDVLLFENMHTDKFEAIKFLKRGYRISGHVLNEIKNLRNMNHPLIVGFNKVLLTQTHLCISMEYAPCGELYNFVRNEGPLAEMEARIVFQQLIQAVHHCHGNRVAHRDIKLDNILIKDDTTIQLCDFGLSTQMMSDNNMVAGRVGTPTYMAPEVFQNTPYDGELSDVWSCGVTLFVLLNGQYPFEDPDPELYNIKKTIQNIRMGKINPFSRNITPACHDLIMRMLTTDPSKRITIPEIMEHEWFQCDFTNNIFQRYNEDVDHQSISDIERIFMESQYVDRKLKTIYGTTSEEETPKAELIGTQIYRSENNVVLNNMKIKYVKTCTKKFDTSKQN